MLLLSMLSLAFSADAAPQNDQAKNVLDTAVPQQISIVVARSPLAARDSVSLQNLELSVSSAGYTINDKEIRMPMPKNKQQLENTVVFTGILFSVAVSALIIVNLLEEYEKNQRLASKVKDRKYYT